MFALEYRQSIRPTSSIMLSRGMWHIRTRPSTYGKHLVAIRPPAQNAAANSPGTEYFRIQRPEETLHDSRSASYGKRDKITYTTLIRYVSAAANCPRMINCIGPYEETNARP